MSDKPVPGFPRRRPAPSVEELANAWRSSTAVAGYDREALVEAVRRAHAQGASEYALAEACGVARATIRAWLGK